MTIRSSATPFLVILAAACQSTTGEPVPPSAAPDNGETQRTGSSTTALTSPSLTAKDAGPSGVLRSQGSVGHNTTPRFDAGPCDPKEVTCCEQGSAHHGCLGECVQGQCIRNGQPWSMPEPSMVCCGEGAAQRCVLSSGCYVPQGGPK